MNPYEVLGVPKTASQDDIKRAYRKLASQHHPDKGGDTARFQQIQSAYDLLSDPVKRNEFDNPTPQHQHFNFHFGPENLHDIFAQFGFGQGHPFSRMHSRKNQDYRTSINIRLEDTLEDSDKNLILQSTNDQKTLSIRIPKGITSGTTIKFPNLGDNTIQQIPAGDLYVNVNVIPHERFQVQGLDIITTLTIDCFQAILGCEQTVIGLDKKVFSLRIPAGCQHNTKLKISGEGLPGFQKDIKGNLLVQLQIKIPTYLSDNQKNLLIQLQQTE